MVGVGVGDGVGGDVVALELAEDPLAGAPAPRVDQDVADQKRVDRVGHRDRVEMPNPLGDLLHGGDPNLDRKNAPK